MQTYLPRLKATPRMYSEIVTQHCGPMNNVLFKYSYPLPYLSKFMSLFVRHLKIE